MEKVYEAPKADAIVFAATEKIALLGDTRDSSTDVGDNVGGSAGSRGDY